MKPVGLIMLDYGISSYEEYVFKLRQNKNAVAVDYAINKNGSIEYQDSAGLSKEVIHIAIMGFEPNNSQMSSLGTLIRELRSKGQIGLVGLSKSFEAYNKVASAYPSHPAPQYVYNQFSLYDPEDPIAKVEIEPTDVVWQEEWMNKAETLVEPEPEVGEPELEEPKKAKPVVKTKAKKVIEEANDVVEDE